jgi:putative endonuclease
MAQYYVYILTTRKNTVLYTGMTNDLMRRMWEHKTKFNIGFTSRYNVDKLVWFEEHNDVKLAIRREKLIKRWVRDWKESLINERNPEWDDLSKDWHDEQELIGTE